MIFTASMITVVSTNYPTSWQYSSFLPYESYHNPYWISAYSPYLIDNGNTRTFPFHDVAKNNKEVNYLCGRHLYELTLIVIICNQFFKIFFMYRKSKTHFTQLITKIENDNLLLDHCKYFL